jgi:hypothetical protein
MHAMPTSVSYGTDVSLWQRPSPACRQVVPACLPDKHGMTRVFIRLEVLYMEQIKSCVAIDISFRPRLESRVTAWNRLKNSVTWGMRPTRGRAVTPGPKAYLAKVGLHFDPRPSPGNHGCLEPQHRRPGCHRSVRCCSSRLFLGASPCIGWAGGSTPTPWWVDFRVHSIHWMPNEALVVFSLSGMEILTYSTVSFARKKNEESIYHAFCILKLWAEFIFLWSQRQTVLVLAVYCIWQPVVYAPCLLCVFLYCHGFIWLLSHDSWYNLTVHDPIKTLIWRRAQPDPRTFCKWKEGDTCVCFSDKT